MRRAPACRIAASCRPRPGPAASVTGASSERRGRAPSRPDEVAPVRRPERVRDERVLPCSTACGHQAERPDEELRVAAAADQVAPEVRQHGDREVGERDGEVRRRRPRSRPAPRPFLPHPVILRRGTRRLRCQRCTFASAWLRARPASCTSAASARSSSTGSSRASRAASAGCGSRTPTRAARSPRPTEQIQESLRWLGIDWDGPVTFQLDRMDEVRDLRGAARRGGQGLRRRGRDPLPDARRGRRRLGRRDPRPDRVRRTRTSPTS